MAPDEYLTIRRITGPQVIRVKGSRFISCLYPVTGADQVPGILEELRREFHDASHICYAFHLLNRPHLPRVRYHDDGEPSLTAGQPILREIEGAGLTNVLLTVVRYFGGTKLGCGGLTRAYRDAARAVIDTARTIPFRPQTRLTVKAPFSLTGEVMAIINKHDLSVIYRHYRPDGMEITLSIDQENADGVRHLFAGMHIQLDPT